MSINTKRSISDIVNENYAYASVLYYFGIKFYDYDEKTLEQACTERGLEVGQVVSSLENIALKKDKQDMPLAAYPVSIVVEYLKHTHFIFIKEQLPYLNKLINNLPLADYTSIVQDLKFIFPMFVEDLIYHIYQEEDGFFSYVLALNEASKTQIISPKLFYHMEQYSIQNFAIEHDIDDDEMQGFRNITNNYAVEHIDHLHLRVVYAELEKFEKELQIHANIENETLFPKALMLEKQVKKMLRGRVKLN